MKKETLEKKDNILKTKQGVKDGQLKCPNCGASEITPNPKTNKLRCNYCSCEFDGKKAKGTIKEINKLKGKNIGEATNDIKKDAKKTVTLICGGCGAEVIVDLENAPHARCHWCRSILSINNKTDNGIVPDLILPFQLKKEEAEDLINDFVSKRKFYANTNFKNEFEKDNIMGVYFPYLLVDANCHGEFKGEGEHLVRSYRVNHSDRTNNKRYDADLYEVERDFDITINGLSIESNSTKLDKENNIETANIINSIMPFDTENCIEYHSNYLVGYTSEKRDINISNIEEKVNAELKDIARYSLISSNNYYDRGVHWEKQDFEILGTQWLSAYLPVWLYSYQEVKQNEKTLHYVAVNARTGETMGSVPINKKRLFLISFIIELIALIISIGIYIEMQQTEDETIFVFLLLAVGFIYYAWIYGKYRNPDARHTYENDTKYKLESMNKKDTFKERLKRLENKEIEKRNDNKLEGENIKIK